MLPGDPPSVPPGDPEVFLEELRCWRSVAGLLWRVRPAAGKGDQWFEFRVQRQTLDVRRLTDGETVEFTTGVPWGRPGLQASGPVLVNVRPLGDWATADSLALDDSFAEEIFLGDKTASRWIEWDSTPVVSDYGCAGQFSAWSLTGLVRHTNVRPVNRMPQIGELDVILSSVGAVHTLQLKNGGVVLASGSRTGDGAITLTASGGSGISGTVTLTYTADVASGGYLRAAWPAAFKVYLDSVYNQTVYDSGLGNRYSACVVPGSAGAHDWSVRAVDETGAEGAVSATGAFTVYARPTAPTQFGYSSGDASACVLQFRANGTAGTVYRVYVREPDEDAVDLNPDASVTPAADTAWQPDTDYAPGSYVSATPWNGLRYYTSASGKSGPTPPVWPTTIGETVDDRPAHPGRKITWVCVGYEITLAAISGYPGTAQAIIAAYNGLCEDGIRAAPILLEFDGSGVYVPGRPNVPGFRLSSRSGRALTVAYDYDGADEAGTPATVQLFLVADGDSPNWSSPSAEEAIAAADGRGIRSGTIAATAGADGQYWFAVRVATAAGTQSSNTKLLGPVRLSTVELDAPDNRLDYAMV